MSSEKMVISSLLKRDLMFFVYNLAEKITMVLAANFLSQVYQFSEKVENLNTHIYSIFSSLFSSEDGCFTHFLYVNSHCFLFLLL